MPFEEAVLEAPAEVDETRGDDLQEEDHDEALDDSSTADEATAGEEDGEEPGEDAGEEGEQPGEVEGDGRKLPDALKKAMSAAKAAGVPADKVKIIKSNYYENQDYRAVFAKPAEAAEAKQLIDTIGGKQGIEEIEAERGEWREIDKAFAEAKPEFVKGLAENNPDAFAKIAPQVLNEWAARNQEQYGYYANQVSLNTLAHAGLSIQNLAAAHAQYANHPEAQAVIADIHNALVGMKQRATEFEQRRVDPREQELKQRESQFEQRQRATFETGVADKAEAYLAGKMPDAMKTVINGRTVDPEAMKGYEKMVQAEVERRLGEIPGFADKLEGHYRSGDAAASQRFIEDHYNRLLPEAVKVIAPYLRNIPASTERLSRTVATPRERGASSDAGSITLKEMPSWDQLDPVWSSRSEASAEVMQGRAKLRSGKMATGWA